MLPFMSRISCPQNMRFSAHSLSGVNCIYYGLKSSIVVEVDILLTRKKCLLTPPTYKYVHFLNY